MSKVVRGPGRPMAYQTKNGKRCPSVTTVLKRFKDSEGLLMWAHALGTRGIDMEEDKKYTARTGTIAHAMIDACIVDEKPKWCLDYIAAGAEHRREASELYERWAHWAMDVGFRPTHTELPLVSEKYRFGGTLDCIGFVKGKLMVADWKRADRVYVDQLLQLSAYREMWNEVYQDQQIDGASVVLLGCDPVQSETFVGVELDLAFSQFNRLLEAYRVDQELQKVVGYRPGRELQKVVE